jgi:hypothetical protein
MINFLTEHKKIIFVILIVFIFLASFFVHYSIYRIKGNVHTLYFNLLVARNWSQTGQVAYESNENVVLSTDMIKTEGVPNNPGNKLTFILYGLLFRYVGFYPDLPIFVSFALSSLVAVLFFLIISRIYAWKVGLIAAFLAILAPFSLPASYLVANHEWALFFLMVATFFYLWPRQRKLGFLLMTGLFLGLSAAAKNSYFIAFIPFLITDFWLARVNVKKAILRSAILAVTFCLVVIPLTFVGGNVYLSDVFGLPNNYTESASVFSHLFPDAYTYHYDQADYLKNLLDSQDKSFGNQFRFWGDSSSFLKEYGVPVAFMQTQIIMRVYSAWIYFKGLFLSLIVFGGLLTWFFIFLGTSELRARKNKLIILFSGSFLFFWFLILVLLRTSNYVHLAIISFPVSLVVALGIEKLAIVLSGTVSFKGLTKKSLEFIIIFIFIIVFAQISWWDIRELSLDFSLRGNIIRIAEAHQNSCSPGKKEIIATDYSSDVLAYYTNCSFVYFAPATLAKLADKKEIESVFEMYGVSGYLGYDVQTTELVKKNVRGLKEYDWFEGI